MKNKKFTFVIDGNWFLISRMHAAGKDDKLTFQPDRFEKDRRSLLNILSQSLAKETTDLEGVIDNIIIVTDKKAWRKNHTYLSDPLLDTEGTQDYKAHRVSDEEVDMGKVFETFYEWLKVIESKFEYTHIQSEGCEGDDLVYIVGKHLTNKGKNCLFLSVDKDLTQINFHNKETDAICVYYRKKSSGWGPKRKQENVLTTSKSVIDYLNNNKEELDPFSNIGMKKSSATSSIGILNEFIDDIEEIDMNKFILYKVFLGDEGDGVPMLFKKPSSTGKRHFKIQEKHIDQAIEDAGYTVLTDNLIYDNIFIKDLISRVYNELYKSKKDPTVKIPEERLDFFFKRFEENRMLMYINQQEIPKDVYDYALNIVNEKLTNEVVINESKNLITDHQIILDEFSMISSDSSMSMYENEVTHKIESAYDPTKKTNIDEFINLGQ